MPVTRQKRRTNIPARIACMAGWILCCLSLLAVGTKARAEGDPDKDRNVIVHAGCLLAIPGERPKSGMTIAISNGDIVEVRPGFLSPQDIPGFVGTEAEMIDLSDSFVMPGLMDAHVHLSLELTPDGFFRFGREGVAMNAIRTVISAENLLHAGFTTVRDVGDPSGVVFDLRDAIDKGIARGPRILAAGPIITRTGGHGYGLYGENAKCDGVGSCRKAVRSAVEGGSDLIKIAVSGGLGSEWGGPDSPPGLFPDELNAIVETSRSLGRKVAAHAHGAASVRAAVAAGVDSVEHGSYLDAEAISALKESGAYLVPTMLVSDVGVSQIKNVFRDSMPRKDYERAIQVGSSIMNSVREAHKAGVKIAFGSDSGGGEQPRNIEEFRYLIKAGLTPMDAIRSATVHTADLLGVADEVGTLEVGKRADIVAFRKNPLQSIEALEEIGFVMKGGEVARSGEASDKRGGSPMKTLECEI